MTTTVLELKSDFALPANPTLVEGNVGSMRITAAVDASCKGCALNAITDFAGAMDHGAFPAARLVAEHAIKDANNNACAMTLKITRSPS